MRWRTTSAVVALSGVGLLGLTACGTGAEQSERKIAVEATDTECKVESTSSPTGSVTFEITNKGDRVTEFYLYGDNDRVISEVENIGPGLTRTMTANVAQAGKYTTACKPGMRGDGIRGAFTVTKGGPTRPSIPQGVVSQYTVLGQEIRDAGGETTSGPWRIGYIVEAAEPWFHSANGQQHHREPAPGETHHIEIIPIEAETGRIVPDVPIRVEVVDSAGKVVDARRLNFYYSEFFHYANNFSVPQAGKYTLRATLDAPTFLRHGEANEHPALSGGATVHFRGVELKPEG